MKKNIKSLIAVLIVCTMFFASASTMIVFASNNIGIVVNGRTLRLDQPPVMESGRTLVPLRAIFEELGAQVDWNSANQTITGTKGNSTIKLVVGNTTAVVDGKEVKMDVPAKVVNGRTLVPTRFVAESLGAVVEWDGADRIVKVTADVVIDEATIDAYIELFVNTTELFGEELIRFTDTLIMTTYASETLIQQELVKLRNNSQKMQSDFNAIKDVKVFEQSQFYMRRVLYYYNLVIADTEELIALAIEGKEAELFVVQGRVETNLVKMESEFMKAIEHFFLEYEAYAGEIDFELDFEF